MVNKILSPRQHGKSKNMAQVKTYSVYNYASRSYMHITATSKEHVRIYLRERGWHIYCDDEITILHRGGESTPIEEDFPEWFGIPGYNIDFL